MANPLFEEISGILESKSFRSENKWHYSVNYLRYNRILIGDSRAHISIYHDRKGYHTTFRLHEYKDRYYNKEIKNLDALYRTVTTGRFRQKLDISSDTITALEWLRANR
ncbi:hypothetical protein FHS76_003024 [Ochrobactrum daejeonense]|uniref:Uncharacterized protein n=1 Tax=Brucella daejeonensis TaxID=659015 RepID=A0A7W9AYV0_9HYPH|nr:hypothetical protein [Brucella daejeonensis]